MPKRSKRQWSARVAGRGRSWSPTKRDIVVRARTLDRAIARALKQAEVDLVHGTGVSLVLCLEGLQRRRSDPNTATASDTPNKDNSESCDE